MPENEPYAVRDETQRKCSTCNIVFQRTTHLRRHMLTHTQDKRFVCSQCGKSFVRRFVNPFLLETSNVVQSWMYLSGPTAPGVQSIVHERF
jgi:predicted RNA-binding Zn-ribbon protein involved in translation (DUF1610 family)